MKTYKEFKDNIDEAIDSPEAFIEQMKKDFHKHFPMGYFDVGYKKIIGDPVISGSFGLIGDLKDTFHRIRENDPMWHSFIIFQRGDGFNSNLEFRVSQSDIWLNPEPGSHYAMKRLKTKLTNVKKNGNLPKFSNKMRVFFSNLAKLVKENSDNIYKGEEIKKYIDSVKQ